MDHPYNPLQVQLDEQTLAVLNRVADPDERKRSEFIRQAIRKAIRQEEYSAMREAYRKQPDSAVDADDWSTAEEYGAETIRDLVGELACSRRQAAGAVAEPE